MTCASKILLVHARKYRHCYWSDPKIDFGRRKHKEKFVFVPAIPFVSVPRIHFVCPHKLGARLTNFARHVSCPDMSSTTLPHCVIPSPSSLQCNSRGKSSFFVLPAVMGRRGGGQDVCTPNIERTSSKLSLLRSDDIDIERFLDVR